MRKSAKMITRKRRCLFVGNHSYNLKKIYNIGQDYKEISNNKLRNLSLSGLEHHSIVTTMYTNVLAWDKWHIDRYEKALLVCQNEFIWQR